jgi:hypothetical protein
VANAIKHASVRPRRGEEVMAWFYFRNLNPRGLVHRRYHANIGIDDDDSEDADDLDAGPNRVGVRLQ